MTFLPRPIEGGSPALVDDGDIGWSSPEDKTLDERNGSGQTSHDQTRLPGMILRADVRPYRDEFVHHAEVCALDSNVERCLETLVSCLQARAVHDHEPCHETVASRGRKMEESVFAAECGGPVVI